MQCRVEKSKALKAQMGNTGRKFSHQVKVPLGSVMPTSDITQNGTRLLGATTATPTKNRHALSVLPCPLEVRHAHLQQDPPS